MRNAKIHSLQPKNKLSFRSIKGHYPESLPKYWLGDSALRTHLANALNLVLTLSEAKASKAAMLWGQRVQDPKFRQEVINFARQESEHGLEHKKPWKNLKKQKVNLKNLFKLWELFFSTYYRLNTDKTRLATLVGAEHLSTLLSRVFLQNGVFAQAPEPMKHLFEWHAAEELEHQCLAFDLFDYFHGKYIHRLIGMGTAWMIVVGFTLQVAFLLLRQDKQLSNPRVWRDAIEVLFTKEKLVTQNIVPFLEYFLPNFHPKKHAEKDAPLMKAILENLKYIELSA